MSDTADYSVGEPPPIPNGNPSIHDLVITDIMHQYPMDNQQVDGYTNVLDELRSRKELGLRKYGTILQADNGRDPLRDAMDEIVDLLVYLRQAIEESATPYPTIGRMYDQVIQNSITLKFILEARRMRRDHHN